ncbi:hypothetical protein EDB80DRAFT_320055 [Ilyonectria destructans]|nr:hypothetical protein EDB80DRAFT_320055 [Ilyonectria destructans]
MDTKQVQSEEPIFELAVECEGLFEDRVSKLRDKDKAKGAKLLAEYQQRFSTWAAFMGVFAEPNVCLDRRLKHHVEIQDLVLRLLDIMARNLTYSFEADSTPELMDIEPSGMSEPPPQPSDTSFENLEAIAGVINRLNHLGTAIRRSSVTSPFMKARAFAEKFDLTSFENSAELALETLYPDASPELREHLTRSMTETYALFRYRQFRQDKLNIARPRTRASSPLLTINENEEPTAHADVGNAMDCETQTSCRIEASTLAVSRLGPRPVRMRAWPQSEPTSLDSREVQARLRSGPEKNKTQSILVNQAAYPRPPPGSSACEWCFSPLPKEVFEEERWKQHVNEDHKPYVCLSEKCSESLPRFATSTEWFQHMLTAHGPNWYREVYLPSWWMCPLCNDDNTSFAKPQGLTDHFESSHQGLFPESQVQAILQQSRLRSPHPRDVCPLCCLSIVGKEASLPGVKCPEKPPSGQESRGPNVEDSHKFVNIESGDRKSVRYSDYSLEKTTDQREPSVHAASPSRDKLSPEVIASHVAAHLQGIMLLTLRIISIDMAADTAEDNQSVKSATGNYPSTIKLDLDQDDLMLETASEGSVHTDSEIDPDDPKTDNIPDSAPSDWDHILPCNEVPTAADRLLHLMILSTFPSHGGSPERVIDMASRFINSCLEQACSVHDNMPEFESTLVLNVMDFWVKMDEAACSLHPLLREFHPVFRPEMLDVLLNSTFTDMERVHKIQLYIHERIIACEGSYMNIFDNPVRGSFGHRSYDDSALSDKLQALHESIESWATKIRSSKEEEWKVKSKEYTTLSKKIDESRCDHRVDENSPLGLSFHDLNCPRCHMVRRLSKIYIQIYEHPLPSDLDVAKAVIFELACPQSLAIYRDVTWTIISRLALPSSEDEAVPKCWVRDYQHLCQFANDTSMSCSLASATKPFLATHYSRISFPVEWDDVCQPNGLELAYYDSRSKRWPSRGQDLSFLQHVKLHLPSTPPSNIL